MRRPPLGRSFPRSGVGMQPWALQRPREQLAQHYLQPSGCNSLPLSPCGRGILFFACPKKRIKRKGSPVAETTPFAKVRNRRGKNSLRSNSLPLHPVPHLAERLSANGPPLCPDKSQRNKPQSGGAHVRGRREWVKRKGNSTICQHHHVTPHPLRHFDEHSHGQSPGQSKVRSHMRRPPHGCNPHPQGDRDRRLQPDS
jgi:hypothetical protein